MLHNNQNHDLTSHDSFMKHTISRLPKELNLTNRVNGMLQGIALGDALGLPLETKTQKEISARYGMVRHFLSVRENPYFSTAESGTISDDTQLSCAVAEGILSASSLDLSSIAQAHVKAFHTTTNGWGGTTRRAVGRLAQGESFLTTGFPLTAKDGSGNGVVMKLAPIAAYLHARGDSLEEGEAFIISLTGMTHRTQIAAQASLAHTAGLLYCMSHTNETFSREEFISTVCRASERGKDYFQETANADDLTPQLRDLPRYLDHSHEQCSACYGGGGSYVYQSLPFSFLFFLRDPFSIESLWETINAGGDTDSNASMVGALLGALNGTEIFPSHLIAGIRENGTLVAFFEQFSAFLEDSRRTAQIERRKHG